MSEITLPIKLQGVHGSPYTRKMLALLRYRRLPYRFTINLPDYPAQPGNAAERDNFPVPKIPLLPTFYWPNEDGKLQAITDSTPITHRLEAAFGERSVVPNNPVLAFLNFIMEDYADEWLCRCMFHYRWYYEADIKKAGQLLPLYPNVSMPEDQHQQFAQYITERQISRLYVVGSNDVTAPVIEDSYVRFLELMEAHLAQHQFLFGGRPSSADFALMGQLTCLTHFDPTPMKLCVDRAPRVYAWVERLEDLCGYEIADQPWFTTEELPDTLLNLLKEAARTHLPQMLANAKAVAVGKNEFETEIDGKPWQQPSFTYQAKCLHWTREEYEKLNSADQSIADSVLESAGLLPLVAEPI